MGSYRNLRQTTLKARVSLFGIGVHSGRPVGVTLCPADANTGISFLRIGLPGTPDVEIRAHHSAVAATELWTVLGDPRRVAVGTVEHLLAALSGLGVDNATIEIDGPEVPVVDGSARPFVEAVQRAGILVQNAPKRFIKVRRPVRVEMGSAFAEFRPHDGRRFEVAIAFDCPVIGSQSYGVELTPKRFRKEIAGARTFGHVKDVERLWAAGHALGSSLENSVAIGEGGVMNPEGLRYPDEFARHKLLDAIGDLSLAGAPILGLYRSYRGGHKVNAMALSALMSQPDTWTIVSASAGETRPEARAEHLSGVLTPAFAELA